MTRSFRSFAVVSCCTAAALLAACGPSTSLPADYASCQSPNAICLASTTATPQCVNLDTDTNNCGECGNVCGVPQQGGTASCVFGQCEMGCANGLTVCGVAQSIDGGADAGLDAPICIDTTVDPNHCGSCNTRCTASQICTAGACVAAGTPAQGTTACGFLADGGVIYDNLQTDRLNCGACGNACATNEICESGACQPCAVAQCNNSCVDTTVDSNNCGSCGTVCSGTSSCNASSCVSMAITVLAPTTSGFLPVGSPNVSVSVAWGIRVAQVTVVAKLTNSGTTTTSNPYTLNFSSDQNLSPTSATFSWGNLQTGAGTMLTSMPALISGSTPETVELDFAAYDEQYRPERTDAASHMTTLTWNGSVATITPIALTTPVATTTIGSTTGAALPTGSWVPLNGGPIVLSETVSAAPNATSNIVGVEFVSSGATGTVVLGGATPVFAFNGASATITVNPTDLGVGARSIIVEQVDVFGNTGYVTSTPLALTIGDIPLYTGTSAQPILAEGIDTKNAIWLFGPSAAAATGSVCSPTSKMFAQPFDQPVSGSTAVGTVVDGATNFCIDALYETFESTGVYGVKADGSAIARFDGVAAETLNFITAPTSPTKVQFRSIVPNSITGAAMAIDDLNGNGWFGNATKGTGDQSPEEAGGADGGSFEAIAPVGGGTTRFTASSTAGALWAWVSVPLGATGASGSTGPTSQSQLDIFHPAVNNNSTHIKSYLANAGGAPATPTGLSVFPGGEFVWSESDVNANLSIGAGRFDGTDQPVDITGATATGVTLVGNAFPAGVKQTLGASGFFVPSPGILVGLIPSQTAITSTGDGSSTSASAGSEVVEIDLTQTPPKIYHPQVITVSGTTPSGEVLASGVTDRFGNFDTFTVSDDLRKVLYVTKAEQQSPIRDEYTINLLDLASGTVTQVYTSEFINNDDITNNHGSGALTTYPHFLHGMNSYAGLSSSSTTPPIIAWAEELPDGNHSTAAGPAALVSASGTVHERLFYANYSSSTITPNQIDHIGLAAYQGVTGTPFGAMVQPLVAESVTGNSIYFLSDNGGSEEISLYARAFDGSTAAQLLVQGVSAWSLREDVGQQLVLRSDGMVLAGALTAGGSLSPIYKSDSGQSSFSQYLRPLAGFTPDGTHAWVLDQFGNQVFSDGEGNILESGILETFDLMGGSRTDWGPVVDFILQFIQPSFTFVGAGTSTLYGVDLANGLEPSSRLFDSTSAAPTGHAPLLNGISDAETSFSTYALNLGEAVFYTGNQYFDVSPSKTTLFTTTGGNYLSGPAPRVQPDFAIFGVQHLPLWEMTNSGSAGIFKQYGTATYQPPITISASGGFGSVFNTATAPNRQTPDNSELLAHFQNSRSGNYFVMKLPGTGVAPLATVPQ